MQRNGKDIPNSYSVQHHRNHHQWRINDHIPYLKINQHNKECEYLFIFMRGKTPPYFQFLPVIVVVGDPAVL